MEPKWYAVHTAPNSEAKASIFLKRQGYQTFFPFLRHKRYVGKLRKMKDADRALFPRYIFVALTKPTHNLFDVNETYGVSTVVSIANEPLEIPHSVIDALMDITEQSEGFEGHMVDEQKHKRYIAELRRQAEEKGHWFKGKPGDTLQLNDEPPYYGLMVCLASVKDIDRTDEISVFVQMLGSRREVSLPAQAVARIVAA